MAKTLKSPDYILLSAMVVLAVFGVLFLASVSAPFGSEKFGNTYYFLKHQLMFGLLPGLILGLFLFKIDLSVLKKWAPTLLLMNLILLVMVFLPLVGSKAGGASRWVDFRLFSFQPSELLKLSFIIYLASWLGHRVEKGPKKFEQTFLAFLMIVGIISLLLILQPDISTLCIIVAIGVLMYFSMNTPLWHTALIFLAGMAGLISLIQLAPYRMNRFLVFLNPERDPMGIGYQVKQILIAIGSGGATGTGLGMSVQKLGFLPQAISDAIFAVFSEETGFVGAVFLIFLFLMLLLRGLKIAKDSQDNFAKLVALGITCWIVVQGFVNIGAMIGILPLMGIPFPFFSYGGTALAAEMAGLGILLNISKSAN